MKLTSEKYYLFLKDLNFIIKIFWGIIRKRNLDYEETNSTNITIKHEIIP